MEAPRVDGLEVAELVGYGGSGRVYRAADAHGTMLAVKIFDEAAISRGLLDRMTRRLQAGGWPAGVLPVLDQASGESPVRVRLSPLVADLLENGGLVPRSLQHRLRQHPGLDSWKLVKSIARALAGMHQRQVAHGNLKPGNVLFDGNGEVLLADWTLGNMPGVKPVPFTDALLYQAPEQLKHPDGYLDEAGYRWDVYAFGVLAFRILTGRFPRCHDTFSYVAPPPGETRREGLKADLARIANNLESHPDAPWPEKPGNPLELRFRGCINRCLELDPLLRPATMVEVAAAFEAVEKELAAGKERELLMDQRRLAERRARRARFGLAAVTAVALGLAALWYLAVSQAASRRSEARTAQAAAETRAALAQQTLATERELDGARLEASRRIGDRLFAWAIEQDHRRLPPLDGRKPRLQQLARYYEDFLTKSAGIAALADERATARLQLAEVALAAGDVAAATRRLGEVRQDGAALPMDGARQFRLAADSLQLALLRQSRDDPETQAAFAAARNAFAGVPRTAVAAERLEQLLAILDLQEAKALAAHGQEPQALETLTRATLTLSRLAEQRPDAAILGSELADCYLSSAAILESSGKPGEARDALALATAKLTQLVEDRPGDLPLRLELAACYGALAEADLLAGDLAGADTLARDAMKLLDALLLEQPDHPEAAWRKAAQLGLRAGIRRDRGLATEAMKDFDAGIRLLEAIRATHPDHAMASYRLALLWWQKGRLLGMTGQRDAEIVLIGQARGLLERLAAGPTPAGPRPEQLRRSTAYLLGDLGHALQLANRKQDAVSAFSAAVSQWQELCEARPRSEEYGEGLTWCRQRIADLR